MNIIKYIMKVLVPWSCVKNLLFTFFMDNTSEDQFMSILFY